MWTIIVVSLLFTCVSCNQIKYRNMSDMLSQQPLFKNMSQVLQLCFSNTSNPIAMSVNLIESFSRLSPDILQRPIIAINEDFVLEDIQLYNPSHPTYVLYFNKLKYLINLLRKLSRSSSWNVASRFFFIFESTSCSYIAYHTLYVQWKFDLLSSFVVCSATNDQTKIYTYNPFTKRAPDPWIEIEVPDVNKDKRWTLYEQPFVNDKKICDSLHFDKTKFLDGYPVKVATEKKTPGIISEVLSDLDITEYTTFFKEYNREDPAFVSLAKRNQDIGTSLFTLESPDNKYVDRLPVIFEGSLVIVTQKQTFTSLFREMTIILDANVSTAIIITLIFITVLIILNNQYQIGWAFLDVLKLLFSMGLDSPLDRLSMKILFFAATLFMYVYEPEIEAQIFSFLSRPPSYAVENLKDLYDQKFHVYYHYPYHDLILEEGLWSTVEDRGYLHPGDTLDPDDCLELASKDRTVACIFPSDSTITPALEKNLHVSKSFLFKENFVFIVRKNWALKNRVHEQLLRKIESGFDDFTFRRDFQNPLKKQKAKERIEKLEEVEIIDEVDLEYFYMFFASCQILGVIAFLFEHLLTWFYRRRN